jgi:branched-subunit amino acid transport protein AzlD
MSERILYTAGVVAVAWAVTFALRALPFLIFAGRGRDVPQSVERFGAIISPVIIAGLIVYSYSALEWRTAWPYLAGALTVGLQIWRRNPLLSIVAGTVLYMCLLSAGCATGPKEIVLDAAHPSIRYSINGFLLGDRFVDPKRIPVLLEEFDVPRDRVIHILVDEEAERNLKPARIFMGMLAKRGYTRSVLVTKKRAESRVRTETEIAEERMRRSVQRRSNAPRKIRYKAANE